MFYLNQRVRVVHTDDPALNTGDEGIVTGYSNKEGILIAQWDKGFRLAMLLHKGDSVEAA